MQDQLAARCGSQRCRILEEPQPGHEGQQGFSMRENKLCRSFGDPLRAFLQGPQQKVVQWADHLGVDRAPVGLFVKVLEVLQELESLHLLCMLLCKTAPCHAPLLLQPCLLLLKRRVLSLLPLELKRHGLELPVGLTFIDVSALTVAIKQKVPAQQPRLQ